MRTALVLTGAVLAILIGAAVSGGQDQPSLSDEGHDVFFAQGCYGCHTIGAVGTPIGPDLSGIGLKYSHATLVDWLRDPSTQAPAAHMPKLELPPRDIAALAAYLSSLRRPGS